MEQQVGDAINYISSCSPYSQIGMGAGLGCIATLVLIKIGKLAALAIGGGIIILEIADQEGFICVDWASIQERIRKITIRGPNKSTIDNASQMASHISNFVIAFIGGSLIGIGCS